MSLQKLPRAKWAMVALGMILALSAVPAAADTWTWDPLQSGGTADSSGTWDTVTPQWWTTTGTDTNWLSGSAGSANMALFGASAGTTSYTVDLGGASLSTSGVTFQSQAYAITNGTLNLGGATNPITVNASGGTIAAAVTGSHTVLINGSGMLTLTGPLNISGATELGTVSNLSAGTLAFNGSSGTIGTFYPGYAPGSNASVYVHAGNLTVNGFLYMGQSSTSSSASYTQDGGVVTNNGTSTAASTFSLSSANATSLTDFTLSGGTMNIKPNANGSGVGTHTYIGNKGSVNFNQSGGLFTFNPTGTDKSLYVTFAAAAQPTTMNISGGTFQAGSGTTVFFGGGSNATMNIGGSGVVQTQAFNLNGNAAAGNATATVNLNSGGLFQPASIGQSFKTGDVGVINLNGGTLQSPPNNSTFTTGSGTWVNAGSTLNVNVGSNGAFIDTNGQQNFTISTPLLQSGGTSTGGLTTSGGGVVTLAAMNSYIGTTTVNAGGLTLSANNNTLSGPVVINNSAVLTIAALNNFNAATTVNSGGTLAVNSSLAGAGGITVASGATLSGSGSIASDTLVRGGGLIDLTKNANSSSLALGSLTFAGGATINLDDAGGQYTFSPAMSVTTLTTSSSPINLHINNVPTGTGTMQIMQYSGSILGSGSGAFHLASPSNGLRSVYRLVDSGGNLNLNYSVDSIYWTGAGNGAWNFSSTNNWNKSSDDTATTFLSGDTVVLDDRASSLTPVVNVNAAVNPASVTFSNFAANYTLTGSGSIVGNAALTVNGLGLVTLANSNTYSGATTISSGTLQLGTGAAGQDGSIASSTSIVNNGTLNLSNVGPTAFAAAIAGPGSVYLSGPGAVTLTGANSFGFLGIASSGSISGGTIALPSGDALVNNATGVTTIASRINAGANGTGETWASGVGTLNIAGGANISVASGGLNFAGGNFAFGGGVLSINASNSTYAFNLNNAAGTTTNFYQSGGSIAIGNANATSNIVYLSTAGNTNYMMTGGTINLDAVSAGSENMEIGFAGGTNNVLTINGPTAVVMPEFLYLSRAFGATGTLNLMNGALATDGLQNGASGAPGYFNFSGGTLQPLGKIGAAWGTAAAGNNCTITLSGSNAVMSSNTAGGAAQSVSVYAVLSGSGALTTAGNGTLTFYSDNSGYSGQLNVTSGTTKLANANALGVGSVNVNGGVLNIASYYTATLDSVTLASGSITGASGVVNANTFNLQSGTANVNLNGFGSPLNKSTSGLAVLRTTNYYSGPTTVNGGTLQLGTGVVDQDGNIDSTSGVSVASGAALVFDLAGFDAPTYSISGNGALAMIGSGILTLSGTNTYQGGTTVAGGTLILTNNEAIADGTSLTVGDPSAFAAPVVPSSAGASLPAESASAIAPVPEPGTLALLAFGLSGAAIYRLRRRRTSAVIMAGAIVLAFFCTCATAARGEEAAWLTDFAAAKAKAKAEKKLLLVDFTGSDWCVWCKRLHNEVFEKEPFMADVPKQFVLVEINLPLETKLPKELKAQNEKLKTQYKINGFPAVLLMDAEGQVLAKTGYRTGGPEKYVENLTKLLKLHKRFVEMQTELAKTEGLDRARLLDRLIEATGELNAGSDKAASWSKEIVSLDPENKTGLKAKYDFRMLMAEVSGLTEGRNYDQALKVVEKLLALPSLTDMQKHEACFAQGYIFNIRGNWPAGQAAMKKVLAAAPKGPKVAQINSLIARMEAVAKDEEAALKLRAELDKTEGPERLKLLDLAIAAYGKVGSRIAGKSELAAMRGWMQEVIRLDADNKAGLKSKYEYRIMSIDGSKLFAAHKIAEAQAVIEKALALPGITEDEISRALIMKCNCLLAQKNYQGVIDCAKKRAETAQGGSAVLLKLIVKQAERELRKEKDDTAQPAPKPAAAESGQDDSWLTDFAAAKTKAKAEKKLLLVDFTGTDWCPFCIALRKQVFDNEPFKTEAPKQFVLVELDFPHEKKLPDEVKVQNDKLARQYKITGFPTVLLMDAEGQVLAQTGFRPGGPEKYVANLAKLLKLHDDVAQMQTELAKTEGLDRARLLDRLIVATTELGTDARKVQEWSKEVVALDPENKTGLKAKYDVSMLMERVAILIKFGSYDQVVTIADKVLAMPGLTDLQKHEAYFAKGFALGRKFDAAASLAALHKAQEAAPDGPRVAAIKAAIQRMEKYTKDVETSRQCLAELDKAEGPDRLKALDRAIDALGHSGSRIDGKNLQPNVKEWMQEVIRLDADNKAGLKSKYEYRTLVLEAQKIYAANKPAEAQALYEKALAVPGISEDNITHATLMKCNCLLAQKDYQGIIDCAKKRAETAQDASSGQLKSIVRQAEAKLKTENASKGHPAE